MANINQKNDTPINIKVAILGKSLVGKSALTYRFISDKFPTEHDTTVEDQYRVNVTIDDKKCDLEILDTAGQDDYQTMLDTWIEFGNCFLLVYSIDDLESFNSVKKKYERICQLKANEEVSVIIVGNKCDLPENERKVKTIDAENYCKSICVEFLESSALNKINVKEAFAKVVQDYLIKTMNDKEKKGGFSCPCF